MSRETRLLIATLVLSVLVVAALSRLRFPELPPPAEAPPDPLERLAASATYEQLARDVERVARRLRPALLVVRAATFSPRDPRRLDDLLQEPQPDTVRHYPALRIDDELAIIAAAPRGPLATLAGEAQLAWPTVVAADALKQLSILRVPQSHVSEIAAIPLGELRTPTYVVVVEGTRAGLAFRPLFVGSTDRYEDARWSRPLLAVSGAALTSHGALAFSLDGNFLGATVLQNGTLAIAPAADILAAVAGLRQASSSVPRDFGIAVQDLTPALADALRAPHGVVVSEVAADSPAVGVLAPTDVITTIDGVFVRSADDVLLQLARTAGPVRLTVLREGAEIEVLLHSARPPESPASPGALLLDHRRGLGSVVRMVEPRHPAARAGLAVDDLIVRTNGLTAPTPSQVASQLGALDAGEPVVLVVRRDGRDRVLAVRPVPSPE